LDHTIKYSWRHIPEYTFFKDHLNDIFNAKKKEKQYNQKKTKKEMRDGLVNSFRPHFAPRGVAVGIAPCQFEENLTPITESLKHIPVLGCS